MSLRQLISFQPLAGMSSSRTPSEQVSAVQEPSFFKTLGSDLILVGQQSSFLALQMLVRSRPADEAVKSRVACNQVWWRSSAIHLEHGRAILLEHGFTAPPCDC